MSSTTTAAADVAGIWFGELSALLQGKRRHAHAMVSSHADHHQQQQQQQIGAAVHGKEKAAAPKPAGAGRREEAEETGGRGGSGAMSDATVYLLLDRFAPS